MLFALEMALEGFVMESKFAKCPLCGEETLPGFIQSRDGLGWSKKKRFVAALALACMLALAGCDGAKQEEASTYSFHGEHDYFAISDGSIVLSDTEETFDGGALEVTQPGFFDEVSSYSTTFYTLTDGEKRVILSNSVIDQTGGSVDIGCDLGKASGKGILAPSKAENIDELTEILWFELETTDLDGRESAYRIQLTVTG